MKDDDLQKILNDMPRLTWACRRGMLELDVLLGNFLKEAYTDLPDQDKALFVQLLEESDPDLFEWLMGNAEPEDEQLVKIVKMIRHHAYNRI